ncbi:MAG: isochorismatase family cysteine hydrolase [Pirellulaceae bacterium]|jgi:nicotinamidase-related amidase|nr:cysteine hydrolase [Planctomycetaceae bacterium]HIM30480.1 cysteine hydrolase [Planctomycetota bacterium]
MSDSVVDSPDSFPGWIMPWPSFDVDWSRSGLVVIDYQNYSSNPDCGVAQMIASRYPDVAQYYLPRIRETLANTRRLLDAYRRMKREVVFTRHGSLLSDGRDMIDRRQYRDTQSRELTDRPTLWRRGSREHEIVAELRPTDDELVIDKNASSPFNGTGIDQLLRNMNLETLVIAGMATDMCVETTARDAADRGYNVIVVEDAVATFFAEHHRAALSALSRVYTKVWSTDQVLSEQN